MRKNCKGAIISHSSGITLIALVVTIVVLLILAGVTIIYALGDKGIFKKASDAKEQFNIAKAREKLETVLLDSQMQKHEKGLTEEELDNQIAKIGGELLPKEDSNSNLQNVLIDGYIFEIDRSVPKIVKYVELADGVIITAEVVGNVWIKEGDTANISVTGLIKSYSGGNIKTVSAMKGETAIAGFSIESDGKYTINNITEDTTIVITAEDTNGKTSTKTVEIKIRTDTILPTVENVNATVENVPNVGKMKIKFNATAYDNESGIKELKYIITSTEDTGLAGIPIEKRKGTFKQGETVEITALSVENKDEIKYTITVTAIDNAENQSTEKKAEAITIYGLTIAEVKEKVISYSALQQYMGVRVVDYVPEEDTTGVYRLFYYDGEPEKGYFGDGHGSIYLIRDQLAYDMDYTNEVSIYTPTDGGEFLKNMNPMWANSSFTGISRINERSASWLAERSLWTKFVDAKHAKYAIAGPSFEMQCRSYCNYKYGTPTDSGLTYMYAINNSVWSGYQFTGNSAKANPYLSADGLFIDGPYELYVTGVSPVFYGFCSPSSNTGIGYVEGAHGGGVFSGRVRNRT